MHPYSAKLPSINLLCPPANYYFPIKEIKVWHFNDLSQIRYPLPAKVSFNFKC